MNQRKGLLAIVFCDLVGSMELTYRLAAEDAETVLGDYRNQVSNHIRAAGGHIARVMGDGILAYFGYPSLLEDDPIRAIRAAMSIINGMVALPDTELRVRIGVSFGEVIVREAQSDGDDTPSVVGHVASLAARLQAMAAPDTVLVSEAVFTACRDAFTFRDLGPQPIRGIPVEERVYLVVAERKAQPYARRLTPLHGRAEEISLLSDLWQKAKSGSGSGVLVSGEPGIGKSRLAAELEHRARSEGAFVVRLHSASYGSNSDLHSLHANLRRVAGIVRADSEAVRRRKIERMFALSMRGAPPERFIDFLAKLGDPVSSEDQSAAQLRERQFDALQSGLVSLSEAVPLLIIHEDAHWIDPTSADWLGRLIEAVGQRKMLILVTARRSFAPDWATLPSARLLSPRRLDADVAGRIVQAQAGAAQLDDDQRSQIIARAEGVPLFLEELTKEALRVDRPPFQSSQLPLTLNAVLVSRLESTGPAKRLAQMAAALGRSFLHDTAALIWHGEGASFETALQRLMDAEIIRPAPIRAHTTYFFRHALLQEAAYESLLRDERIAIHARIVDTLLAARLRGRPEVIAHHCEGAEFYDSASEYWLEAGTHAAERGAVKLAANCFRRGLAAAEKVDLPPEEQRTKFMLLLSLGSAAMAETGYAGPEGTKAFQDARGLLHCSRNSREELQVLLGVFNVYFGRGELPKALEVARQAHEYLLLGFGGYPVLMGQVYCYMGRFSDAHTRLKQALAVHDPSLDGNLGLFCSADVVATSFLAKVAFAQGRVTRSCELTHEALRLARAQRQPIAIAIAQLGLLFWHIEMGDYAAAEGAAAEAFAHTQTHDLGLFKLWVAFFQAATSLQKDPKAAIEKMRTTLVALDAAGSYMFRPAQLAILGGALASIGQHEAALQAIDQGLSTAEQTSGREAIPALHRLKAKLLAKANPAAASSSLQASLAEARQQGAVFEELRTATLLARGMKQSAHAEQGMLMLKDAYSRIERDCHHHDVKFALRVIGELSG